MSLPGQTDRNKKKSGIIEMILRERGSKWFLKDFGDDSLDSVRRMWEWSHYLGVSGSISLFQLSWGVVIGIHVGKVGAHIGKDHHLGSSRVKICAADSGESLKTEEGLVESRSLGQSLSTDQSWVCDIVKTSNGRLALANMS